MLNGKLLALALAAVLATSGAEARRTASHSDSYASGSHTKAPAYVARNSHGRIARSTAAKDAFKHEHPCPSTGKTSGACPGYVIDHIDPLKRGGADAPSNMQWQTTAAAKEKDKTE